MCGIAGIAHFDAHQPTDENLQSELKLMADLMSHRGPDGTGYYTQTDFADYSVGLAHRRLAIIDLSENGHQPMLSSDQNLCLTYNGEIYNYLELREELKNDYQFQSQTDSEVILAAYQKWGENCVHRFNGMFSFVIYDKRQKRLFGARDRFGIKPFYYSFIGKNFYFASEIKQLWATNPNSRKPNQENIEQFLLFGDINCFETTCFENIFELQAGHRFTLDLPSRRFQKTEYYWSQFPTNSSDHKNFEDLQVEFSELLEDSIKIRLRSDVEVGACLSGGLDSSSIVGLASRQLDKPMHTFTSCFDDARFDEREFAQAVNRKSNAIENLVFPDMKLLDESIESLIWHMDEPFRTTSVYAQWSIMKTAQQNNIKVLLDGQGADEALSGYHWYLPVLLAHQLRNKQFSSFAISTKDFYNTGLLTALESAPRFFAKMAVYVGNPNIRNQLSKNSLFNKKLNFQRKIGFPNDFQELSRQDIRNTMKCLLRYEDRNSMAFSIESRTPFLDYRLVEFLQSVPIEMRYHKGWTKSLLRHSVKDVIPQQVTWRVDKKGFVTPEKIFLSKLYDQKFDQVFQHSRLSDWYDLNQLRSDFENRTISQANLWKAYCIDRWLQKFEMN